MAPANCGALNSGRLTAIAWKNPAYDFSADRNQNGASEPAAAWRDVSKLCLSRERLAVGCELAATLYAHALISALHQRVPLNDRRPSGGNQWSRAPRCDRVVRAVRPDILLFFW